jgi:hypothetical protein
MIYGIAVTCQFTPDVSVPALLDAICNEGFLSVKGTSAYEETEEGIGGVYINTPVLPQERTSSVPSLTTLSAPVVPPPRVLGARPGNLTLSGDVFLKSLPEEGHRGEWFFRERSREYLLRILNVTVSINRLGTSILFFSSSHVWLSRFPENPLIKFADANLSRLAGYVAKVCTPGRSVTGTSFSRSLKGPFPEELERLSSAFSGLPGFSLD